MADIAGVKIVEENAGYKNSLILTYTDASGQMKGVVVAWTVDDHVGQTIDIPPSLIPADATNVQFGVIPNGGGGGNPTGAILDLASAGTGATVFDIEGKTPPGGGVMRHVTFDGHDIKGAAGADLLLQSESKNPAREPGQEHNDADDYVAGDETGSNDTPDQEVTPAAPYVAGERDLTANPLTGTQLGFEDRFLKSDGDFNDLIIEVIPSSPTPPTQGSQTASETATLTNGQDLTVSLTGPEAVSQTPFDVSGLLSLTDVGEEVNFLFIVDTSGSTFLSGPTTGATVGDVDKDGFDNTYLDYELAGVLAVQNEIAGISGGFDFNLGYVDFNSSAGTPFSFEPGDDLIQELTDAGRQPFPSGGTNFEPPLQQAINYFTSVDPDQNGQNFVLFISDGQASTFFLADELATLEDPNGINATIKAVGFGSGASKTALDVVDSDDDAIIIVDPGDLPNELPEITPIDRADISSVELLVNGTVEDSFTAADLTTIPGVGLSLDTATVDGAILGDGLADLIQLTVNTTDGDAITTGFYIGEIGQPDKFVLDSVQSPVDYIKGFNADEGDELVLNFATGALALQATTGGDGDDFDLVDTGSGDVVVQLVNAVGVGTVDDLFALMA